MPAKTPEERAAALMEGGITTPTRIAAIIRAAATEATKEARIVALQETLEIAKGSADHEIADAIAALLGLLRTE